MVRSRYSNQTNRDPKRDKIHDRSNHQTTSEPYRCLDDIFAYEQQLLPDSAKAEGSSIVDEPGEG